MNNSSKNTTNSGSAGYMTKPGQTNKTATEQPKSGGSK